MKPSEVLRRAARRMEREENTFSCCAIGDVIGLCVGEDGFNRHPAVEAYSVLWGHQPEVMYFCADYQDYHPTDLRVLALCLAAAIAESEGQ